MKRTTRETFLTRMRQAVQAWGQPAVHHATATTPSLATAPTPRTQTPSTTTDNRALVAQFAEMLTAAGGTAHVVASADDAIALSIQIARQKESRSMILTRHSGLVNFPTAFVSAGLTTTVVGFAPGDTPTAEQRATQRAIMARADLVISGADYAIAETGTLAMVAGPHNPRMATLLPPVHIAILDPRRLVPTMMDLVSRFKTDHLQDGRLDISSMTFITGPSRTGDIEQTLSVGVHGPGEVHVIILSQ